MHIHIVYNIEQSDYKLSIHQRKNSIHIIIFFPQYFLSS